MRRVPATVSTGFLGAGKTSLVRHLLAHDDAISDVCAAKLACADLVGLNKADFLEDAALARLEGDIAARLRPGVRLVAARHGRGPAPVALGVSVAAEDDLAARPSLHE